VAFPVLRKNSAKTKESKQAFVGQSMNACLGEQPADPLAAAVVEVQPPRGLHQHQVCQVLGDQYTARLALAWPQISEAILRINTLATTPITIPLPTPEGSILVAIFEISNTPVTIQFYRIMKSKRAVSKPDEIIVFSDLSALENYFNLRQALTVSGTDRRAGRLSYGMPQSQRIDVQLTQCMA
jgi:hypothetical protein